MSDKKDMKEKKSQEYATIISSNVGAITPTKYGGARSDGVFSQFNDERIKELPTDNNIVALTDVTFIPYLDEVSFVYKEDEYKAIYVKNPAKNRANELVTFYKKEDGKWKEVKDFSEIQINGMKKNAYRIGNISDVIISLFEAIKEYRNYDFSDKFRANLGVLIEMAIMDESEDKVTPPVPDVENVEKLTTALQNVWLETPDEIIKETIKSVISRNDSSDNVSESEKSNLEELRKIIEALEKGDFILTADDISYIDESTLYKITDDYVKNKKNNPILEADRKMALRLKELNKEHLTNAKRKVLNYYIVGLTVEGNPVIVKNEAIRNNSFYNDAENIKKKSLEYYMDLMRNFEKFKKNALKGDKHSFLQVLGVWNEMLNKSSKFIPRIEIEDGKELTTEEYKKIIEKIKKEMENNETLKQEFFAEIENGLLFTDILKESNFVNKKIAYTFEKELLTIKEKFTKDEDVVELFAQYRKAQKAITNALNSFKETVFAFKMNETVVPVDDNSSFPRMVSNTSLITYGEISNLKYNNGDNYIRNVVLGFTVKEVGKEGNTGIVPLLMPIALYDNDKNIAKFDTRASNLTYIVEELRKVFKLANIEINSEVKVDDVYTTKLNNMKKGLVERLEKLEEQKGSKIFVLVPDDKNKNKELIREIYNEIKKATTFTDLVDAVKKIPAFKDIDKLPNLSVVANTKRAESDIVQNYLKNDVLIPNKDYQYFSALHNTYLAEIIKNAELGDKSSFEENNLFTTYVKYYLVKAIEGNTVYKPNNSNTTTFLPAPGLGDTSPEKIKQILLKESNKIELSNDIREKIKKEYGYKSKSEKFKETMSNLSEIAKKQTKNPMDKIVGKKIQKVEENPEEMPEKITQTIKQAEKETLISTNASIVEPEHKIEADKKNTSEKVNIDFIDPAEVSEDMGLFDGLKENLNEEFGSSDPFLNDIDEDLFNNRFDENPFDKEGGAKSRPKMK